jgi:sigma-B regulation protein RsbU (phosphoserine phosphatase)
MLIRWKLLILLLSMALIPLLIVAWFDQRATHRAGRELAAMNHRLLVEGASRNLRQLVSDYALIVRRGRELLELALHLQAGQVEKGLAGGLGPVQPVYSERDFNQPAPSPPGLVASGKHLAVQGGSLRPLSVSYVTQVLKAGPTQSPQASAAEAAKLSGLSAAYQFLERRHPKLIFLQTTVLESGLISVYPGHGGFAEGYDPRREEIGRAHV